MEKVAVLTIGDVVTPEVWENYLCSGSLSGYKKREIVFTEVRENITEIRHDLIRICKISLLTQIWYRKTILHLRRHMKRDVLFAGLNDR